MSSSASLVGLGHRRRVPVVQQTEATECGLACLAMIAGYHGYRTDLGSLRRSVDVSLRGSTLKSLVSIAGTLNLSARPLRVELHALEQVRLPCILHWEMDHFVVLKELTHDGCVIHDPALGVRRLSTSELSKSFTGIALELTPTPNFEKRDIARRMRVSDLWQKATGLKRVLFQLLILSLIIQIYVIAAPLYMQVVVDDVLTKFDLDLLSVLAIGFGGLVLIDVAATTLRGFVILHVSNMLGFQMVSNLFHHLVRLPLDWFEKRHVGDILSRFGSTEPIKNLIAEGVVASIIDGFLAIGALVMLFIYSPLLTSLILIATALYAAIRISLYGPLRRRTEEQVRAIAVEQSAFVESVRGIQSIKVFGQESERMSYWQNKYASAINSGVRIGKLKIGFEAANKALFGIEKISSHPVEQQFVEKVIHIINEHFF